MGGAKGMKLRPRRVVRPAAPSASKVTIRARTDAEAVFVQGVLTRDEAAEVRDDGTLPAQATHVRETDAEGRTVVRRARFKLT